MSESEPMSYKERENIALEGAIAIFANAKVDEIALALRKVPRSITAKIAIAIGMVWQ